MGYFDETYINGRPAITREEEGRSNCPYLRDTSQDFENYYNAAIDELHHTTTVLQDRIQDIAQEYDTHKTAKTTLDYLGTLDTTLNSVEKGHVIKIL